MIRTENKLSVRRQCELLGVPRSTVYKKEKGKSEKEIEKREDVMQRIDKLHTEMPYIGTRKLSKKLKEQGCNVGRKYVRHCMQDMAIRTIYPKINLSKRNYKEAVVPYLLKNYTVDFSNQVWSIDITYIKWNRHHMYLTAIIDWYSRKIVGWNLSDTLETSCVTAALTNAEECGIPGIINSDQGVQFTSEEYKQYLKKRNIRQSMDGKSRWADNIMIERWFRSLKTELIYVNEFSTPKELRMAIEEYIVCYNSKRPHEALGYKTPDEVYCSSFQAA